MDNKLIFFDIDGTLINFDGVLPRSAQNALHAVREKGHEIFLCTGRSKCQIDERLLNFGFDGMVAAAGAYVEHQGEVILSLSIGEEKLRKLITFCEQNRMLYMIQCTDKIVSTAKCAREMQEEFERRRRMENGAMEEAVVEKIMANHVVDDGLLSHVSRYRNVEKVTYHRSGLSLEKVKEALVPDFEVTAMSFESEENAGGEIALAGVTKASGMQKLLEKLGADRKNTIAFGDGPNDFEMIDFAGTGVVMGNASKTLKEHADLVTKRVDEDGIYYGLEQLGLL